VENNPVFLKSIWFDMALRNILLNFRGFCPFHFSPRFKSKCKWELEVHYFKQRAIALWMGLLAAFQKTHFVNLRQSQFPFLSRTSFSCTTSRIENFRLYKSQQPRLSSPTWNRLNFKLLQSVVSNCFRILLLIEKGVSSYFPRVEKVEREQRDEGVNCSLMRA